jgi:hypothetical protein
MSGPRFEPSNRTDRDKCPCSWMCWYMYGCSDVLMDAGMYLGYLKCIHGLSSDPDIRPINRDPPSFPPLFSLYVPTELKQMLCTQSTLQAEVHTSAGASECRPIRTRTHTHTHTHTQQVNKPDVE